MVTNKIFSKSLETKDKQFTFMIKIPKNINYLRFVK